VFTKGHPDVGGERVAGRGSRCGAAGAEEEEEARAQGARGGWCTGVADEAAAGLLKEELNIDSVNARRTLVQAVCREIEGLVRAPFAALPQAGRASGTSVRATSSWRYLVLVLPRLGAAPARWRLCLNAQIVARLTVCGNAHMAMRYRRAASGRRQSKPVGSVFACPC